MDDAIQMPQELPTAPPLPRATRSRGSNPNQLTQEQVLGNMLAAMHVQNPYGFPCTHDGCEVVSGSVFERDSHAREHARREKRREQKKNRPAVKCSFCDAVLQGTTMHARHMQVSHGSGMKKAPKHRGATHKKGQAEKKMHLAPSLYQDIIRMSGP